jgi:hypothetical protein
VNNKESAMINPIEKSNFFVTPTSFEELTQALDNIGSAEERRMAWLGAMMAWNLAHEVVEKSLKEAV